MGVKLLKPTTPDQDSLLDLISQNLLLSSPEKKLTRALRKTGGRNNTGRITIVEEVEVTKDDIELLTLKEISLIF